MVWLFIGVVAKLARRWLCTPVIVGSTPTDSSRCQDLAWQVPLYPKSHFLNPNSAGVAQWAQERSPGTTEAVSSILTTGSNFSGCRVEATHLPWEQVHAGSIPAIQTKGEG